jgi:hypothetical protein
LEQFGIVVYGKYWAKTPACQGKSRLIQSLQKTLKNQEENTGRAYALLHKLWRQLMKRIKKIISKSLKFNFLMVFKSLLSALPLHRDCPISVATKAIIAARLFAATTTVVSTAIFARKHLPLF